jgi:hypothetical protein
LGRISLAAALIAIFLVVVAVAEKGGGHTAVRVDHAVRLVPADALLYVHADVDRGSEQWKLGTQLSKRLPLLAQLRARLLRSLTRGRAAIDLEREVYPWLGREAALALLPSPGGTARSLVLLGLSDPELARAFLDRVVGRARTTVYHGVTINARGALGTAFLGGFLLISRPENLRAAVRVRDGSLQSLDRQPAFARTRAHLPSQDQLLYAYAPAKGVRSVIGPRPGLVGWLGRLIEEPGLRAAAAAVRAEANGVRIKFASVSSSGRARDSGVRAPYHPALAALVPSNAVAYIDMRGADRILSSAALFGRASLSLPRSLRPLRTALASGDRRLRREIRSLLQNETALVVTPSRGAPVVSLLVNDVNEIQATNLLLRLQPLLTRLGRSSIGVVPIFEPRLISGVTAATLRITPALALTFAVYRGSAIISTSPNGVRAIATSESHLTENPLFVAGAEGHLGPVTSVTFLDLRRLLALGEQLGLSQSSGYQAFKADLSHVRALSAVTSTASTSKSAEIFIEVK